jgi:hypothetical protein
MIVSPSLSAETLEFVHVRRIGLKAGDDGMKRVNHVRW